MTSEFFIYDKKRVIQALRYHFITRKEIRILLIAVNLFAILSAGLFYFRQVSPLAFLIGSCLWLMLMIVFWFFLPRMIYGRTAAFRDGFTVRLEEQGMSIINDRGSNSWPWSSFSSFMESPHFFHFYLTERSFFIVPKEAFTDDRVHEARKMIAGNIKQRSK